MYHPALETFWIENVEPNGWIKLNINLFMMRRDADGNVNINSMDEWRIGINSTQNIFPVDEWLDGCGLMEWTLILQFHYTANRPSLAVSFPSLRDKKEELARLVGHKYIHIEQKVQHYSQNCW